MTSDLAFDYNLDEATYRKVWRCRHCGARRQQEAQPGSAGCPNDVNGQHSWSVE